MNKKRVLLACLVVLCLLFLQTGNAFAKTNPPKSSHHTRRLSAAASPDLEGQWPDQAGCWGSDAYVWGRSDAFWQGHEVVIALWANDYCGTNWADFQILDGTVLHIEPQVMDVYTAQHQQIGNGFEYSSRAWSQMIYTPVDPAFATGNIDAGNFCDWSITISQDDNSNFPSGVDGSCL